MLSKILLKILLKLPVKKLQYKIQEIVVDTYLRSLRGFSRGFQECIESRPSSMTIRPTLKMEYKVISLGVNINYGAMCCPLPAKYS